MTNDRIIDNGASAQHAEDTSTRRTSRVEWIERWRDVIASEPELPGVWRRQEGGFRVRGRTTDPRTGKMKEINWALPNVAKARDAFAWLQSELERVRSGVVIEQPSQSPKFHAFAANVFQRKLDLGKIRSEAGRAKWSSILDQHLVPEFGDLFVDQLKMADIKAWQGKIAKLINAGKMSPATANTILGVLRQITDEAVDDFDIRDPMRGIDAFDTREHSTYTEEEPNSLAPDQVPSFLSTMLELHSAHYAFTFLGFTTGLRPSSLRPLRREGVSADIKWDDGILVVRRSQTIGDKVMETTKTDLHQRLTLPRELLDVLRWHVNEQLLHTPMRRSELLFPSVNGGFRARSVLDKPFDDVSKAIGLKFNFTPRGMRRTYQDLARAAGIHDAVTRAISGHQTQEMQLLYSTARGGEVKQALSKVAKIATAGAKIIDIKSVRRRKSA
jgi:integrase